MSCLSIQINKEGVMKKIFLAICILAITVSAFAVALTDNQSAVWEHLIQTIKAGGGKDLPAPLNSLTYQDLLKADDKARLGYIKTLAQYYEQLTQDNIDGIPAAKTQLETLKQKYTDVINSIP